MLLSVIAIVSLVVETKSCSAQSFPKQHFQALNYWFATLNVYSHFVTLVRYIYTAHLNKEEQGHHDAYWNRRTDTQPVKQIKGLEWLLL